MSAPTVTVVVPTHARPAQIEACLDGIAELDPAGRIRDRDRGRMGGLAPSRRRSPPGRTACQYAYGRRAVARQRLEMMGPQSARGRTSPLSTTIAFPCNGYAALLTYAQHYYRSKGRQRAVLHDQQPSRLQGVISPRRRVSRTSIWSRHRRGSRVWPIRWLSYNFPIVHVPTARSFTLTLYFRGVSFGSTSITGAAFSPASRSFGGSASRGFVPEPVSFYWNLILFPVRDRGRNHVWRDRALMIAAQLATDRRFSPPP